MPFLDDPNINRVYGEAMPVSSPVAEKLVLCAVECSGEASENNSGSVGFG
jgi:hypothetical protein